MLLSISASWCHGCAVMDTVSYGDRRVAALIAEDLVPVRVDADRRPDVNDRYNLDGWPTTVLLTPSGEMLTGTTYLPADGLLTMLDEVDARLPVGPRRARPARRCRGGGAPRTAARPALGRGPRPGGAGLAGRPDRAGGRRRVRRIWRRRQVPPHRRSHGRRAPVRARPDARAGRRAGTRTIDALAESRHSRWHRRGLLPLRGVARMDAAAHREDARGSGRDGPAVSRGGRGLRPARVDRGRPRHHRLRAPDAGRSGRRPLLCAARPPTRASISWPPRRCAARSRRPHVDRTLFTDWTAQAASAWIFAGERLQRSVAVRVRWPRARRRPGRVVSSRAKGWRTTWTGAPACAACSPIRCTPRARCWTCTRPRPTRRGR